MRLGKFAVQGNRFRNHDYELLRAIQKDMVVLDIEHNIYRDTATYTAEHPAFDEIDYDEITPTYEVLIDVDGDDNMVVEFKRITE